MDDCGWPSASEGQVRTSPVRGKPWIDSKVMLRGEIINILLHLLPIRPGTSAETPSKPHLGHGDCAGLGSAGSTNDADTFSEPESWPVARCHSTKELYETSPLTEKLVADG